MRLMIHDTHVLLKSVAFEFHENGKLCDLVS
jgi:hypothetical protein